MGDDNSGLTMCCRRCIATNLDYRSHDYLAEYYCTTERNTDIQLAVTGKYGTRYELLNFS